MKYLSEKLVTLAGFMVFAVLAGTSPSPATPYTSDHPAFALASNVTTSIPVGHADFCRSHKSECGRNANVVETIALSQSRWDELLKINSDINSSIVPVTDEQLYKVTEFWTYPNGYGDCEDFVLAKRKALIDRGWAPSTLLITVVRQQNGEGHAVLMVRTDRGDLVLDNQEGLIKVWSDTPYRYIKRQSQTDAGKWVDILDSRPVIIASR